LKSSSQFNERNFCFAVIKKNTVSAYGNGIFLFLRKIFRKKLKNAPYAVFMICKEKTKTTKNLNPAGK